jgi:hypothetical protein
MSEDELEEIKILNRMADEDTKALGEFLRENFPDLGLDKKEVDN